MAGALETVWSIMARLGPEDALAAVPLPRNSSSFATAGNDWAIVKQKVDESAFHYKDAAEAQRLAAIVESDSQDNRILRDLASTRYLCAQPSFALELCQRSFRAHQLKQCTPVYVEHLKCSVKLARAVDILCRPQYTSLTTCLRGAGGDASQCIPQVTAFDTCTESF